jgi:hypothetical protein
MEIPFIVSTNVELPSQLVSSVAPNLVTPEITRSDNIVLPNFVVPNTDDLSETMANETVEEWATSCYEWGSLAILGSPRICSRDDIDSYLCNYSILDPTEGQWAIATLTWTGLIPMAWTLNLWKQLRDGLPGCEWFSLNVQGIEDSPIAWLNKEHTFHFGGENHYTIFRLEDGRSLCFKVVSGKDLSS